MLCWILSVISLVFSPTIDILLYTEHIYFPKNSWLEKRNVHCTYDFMMLPFEVRHLVTLLLLVPLKLIYVMTLLLLVPLKLIYVMNLLLLVPLKLIYVMTLLLLVPLKLSNATVMLMLDCCSRDK